MSERTLLAWVLVANAAWTVSLVVAPLSLAPGTVAGLDGRANVIDYAHEWSALPLLPRLVYTAGDLNCHQMASRSWEIGGNQIPVDVRMFAGFLFGNVGLGWALMRPGLWRYRDAAAQFWPQRVRVRLDSPRRRLAALSILWAVAVLPALVDVMVQIFTAYESTNGNRFVTGSLLGLVGGFLIGALLRSMMQGRPEGLLPSPAQEKSDG